MFQFITHSHVYSAPGQAAFEAWKICTGRHWTVKRQRGSTSPL